MAYVVAVKPSARRTSATVGRWVRDHGSRRTFASKALAREWARAASAPRGRVWVQDAVPNDSSDADGYLVGRRRPRRRTARGGTSVSPTRQQARLDGR
ncbi:hypothetical protein [Halomarina litorea]|uniref:hypothetical protein n=1 Tax=Halomarina litorea TaxID=2961595 RepID=UPI0020C37373|nr:hypothetical protein [Halomarina sp. BCD28]